MPQSSANNLSFPPPCLPDQLAELRVDVRAFLAESSVTESWLPNSDFGCLIHGIAVHSTTDSRECHGLELMVARQLERTPVATGQKCRLTVRATMPNWADRMDPMFRR